ncbi:metal ABC transporter substrate-binding protein [Georgenia sp. Z1491]|uniref:metal ABC transporter substrate-binding protein n=1 Tax=Georgenia sp. Z1491 TaxID=3416707 RepID=UPI003CFA67D5
MHPRPRPIPLPARRRHPRRSGPAVVPGGSTDGGGGADGRTRGAAARTSSTALAAAALLAACSGSDADDPAADADAAAVVVMASFYPLQFVVERVGGEHVSVDNLTPPGADPHSLELSPAEVAQLESVDLVTYVPGLQAATDDAIGVTDPAAVLDAAEAAGVAEDDLARDPHFWLDPTLVVPLVDGVADTLGDLDPENAEDYAERSADLVAELTDLDDAYREGLAACAGATLVTSHEAFGYLAERDGLEQVGISGIDPEVEPSPARLREVGEVVRAEGVQTLYFEVIAGPDVVEALAADLDVDTDVLDPIEGQTDPDADYLDVMRSNLAALERGLVCDG